MGLRGIPLTFLTNIVHTFEFAEVVPVFFIFKGFNALLFDYKIAIMGLLTSLPLCMEET